MIYSDRYSRFMEGIPYTNKDNYTWWMIAQRQYRQRQRKNTVSRFYQLHRCLGTE